MALPSKPSKNTTADVVTPISSTEPAINSTTLVEETYSSDDHTVLAWEDGTNTINPRNWASWRKWLTITIVSFTEFLTHLTSLMYAPGLKQMQLDLEITDETLATMTMTVYVLGFGVGPLLFSPLSEVYGRMLAYRISITIFVILNIACAVSTSVGMLIAFRFLAGCFGAAPVAIGGAIVSDLFQVENRGRAMAVYHMGPVLGNLLGPPVGGAIIEVKGWRWVFWVMSILAGFACFCAFVILQETHHPTIQRQRCKNPLSAHHEHEVSGDRVLQLPVKPETRATLAQALRRPIEVLLYSPVVDLTCLIVILQIGTQNLVFASLGAIFQDVYDFSPSAGGLVYLGVTIGFVVAAFMFGRLSDRISVSLAVRRNTAMLPEFRLVFMTLGLTFCAGGLFWYGWSIAAPNFWLVPVLGLGMLGIGLTTVQLSANTYLVDAYTDIAASVLASSTLAKSIGGSIIPLAGPPLYSRFGLGWGNSFLAFFHIGFCGIALVLFLYGHRMRICKESSAHDSISVHQ